MSHSGPLLDLPDDPPQSCDSPSGSSTSEPHDENMHLQQPFIDQSFFHKLDQLSPDNPLYFMQQSQQHQEHLRSLSDENEDEIMRDGFPDADLNMTFSQQHSPEQQGQAPYVQQQQKSFVDSVNASTCSTGNSSNSIVEPLQPNTVPTSEGNQTFWSGINNFFANVAHNPFPQAIPNLARNFTDYLASSYPAQVNSTINTVSGSTSTGSTASASPSVVSTPPMISSEATLNPSVTATARSTGMQIRVLGVPQNGAKSRVETQIKLCIQLVTDEGDKAQWWSHLKLPEHMVAKDKLKRQIIMSTAPNGERIANVSGLDNTLPIQPEKMLFLRARVICASDPSRKVVTCLGCIQRERKRSQRRKENRIKAEADEEKRQSLDDEKSLAFEEQKVLLFNCSEVVDFSSGDTILPTRITCYCRHHNERVGFCIYFEMHDHTGKRVATGMSPPIMITDDHKSNKVKTGRKRPRTDIEQPSQRSNLGINVFPPFTQTPQNGAGGAAPLQYPLNGFSNNPSSSQLAIQPRPNAANKQDIPSAGHSPLLPATTTSLKTPQVSPINPAMNAFLQSPAQAAHMRQLNQDLFGPLANTRIIHEKSPAPPPPQPAADRPQLQRLIPNEGPTFGGIEVTILGSNFRPGLTCMFGEVPATSTHYWSPNTLVCILPPAAEPGPVVVCFKEYPVVMDSQEVMLFTYYNENDRALMELALQVVGLKMTGKVEDAREIAMRIVQGGSQNHRSKDTSTGGNENRGQQHASQNQTAADLERQIIQVLRVMDTVEEVESADVSIANAQGHTMLHLAAMLGFEELTLTLLELGCDVDATDRNGYSALHYATWLGHEELVRILLDEGDADPEIGIAPAIGEIPELASLRRIQEEPHHDSTEQPVASIQYLQLDDTDSNSTDEIPDAQAVRDHDTSSDNELSTNNNKANWMQRTLSHFQQPKHHQRSSSTDSSFLQNLKNNIPTKATDINLKTIADHLLQLSRPTTARIANVSVLFSNDPRKNTTGEEPEETLAWYMALAYAMGARSSSTRTETSQRPNRKQHHVSAYTPVPASSTSSATSADASSSAASSSFDSYYSGVLETMQVRKRNDQRLFLFWVPLLCLMVFWLIYQFTYSSTYRALIAVVYP